MDAVLDLVSEHGYARASVGEIERHAGMAPRSGASSAPSTSSAP
jgi:AcrR family transcriptional regulator